VVELNVTPMLLPFKVKVPAVAAPGKTLMAVPAAVVVPTVAVTLVVELNKLMAAAFAMALPAFPLEDKVSDAAKLAPMEVELRIKSPEAKAVVLEPTELKASGVPKPKEAVVVVGRLKEMVLPASAPTCSGALVREPFIKL